jgi:hypothetical protein
MRALCEWLLNYDREQVHWNIGQRFLRLGKSCVGLQFCRRKGYALSCLVPVERVNKCPLLDCYLAIFEGVLINGDLILSCFFSSKEKVFASNYHTSERLPCSAARRVGRKHTLQSRVRFPRSVALLSKPI